MVRDWSSYSCQSEDIISHLLQYNLHHVVLQIFRNLDSFSISQARKVSETWNDFVVSDYNFTSSRRVISLWSRGDVLPERSLKCRDTVQSLALRGQLLVCGLQNGEVQVWSVPRRSLDCVAGYHGTAVTAVALAGTDPVIILSGSWRQEVKLYNHSDNTHLASVRLTRKLVRSISVTGSLAAVGCVDIGSENCQAVSTVTVVELSRGGGQLRRVIETGPGLSALACSGERLAVGGDGWLGVWRLLHRENYTRQVYNRQDGTSIHTWHFAGGWVTSLLHLQERTVLAGDEHGTVRLYLDGQMVVKRSVFPSAVTSLASTEDVVVVVTYTDIHVWARHSLLSPGTVTELQRLSCHIPVTATAVSELSLTACLADGTVVTWDFSSPGRADRPHTEAGALMCSLCGAAPDTALHYFLQCPALVRPRQRLLQEMDSLVSGFRLMSKQDQMEIILYGAEDEQQAIDVRDAVQTFVVKTRT